MDIVKTIKIDPGHYVVAVSGGVDSMALLDMLVKMSAHQPGHYKNTHAPIKLTVAHFDHGIRDDSKEDRKLVQNISRQYGLPFVYHEGVLGRGVSEDIARKARYTFLDGIKNQVQAKAVITAHHQDDVLETAVHNLLRGTGRKGMSSLKSVDGIKRPLLHIPKAQLIDYATKNNLVWREDSTNTDTTYKRNYIRHVLLPKMKAASPEGYQQLRHLVRRQADLNHAIDKHFETLLHVQPAISVLSRHDTVMLPHAVARELVAAWLRQNGFRQFNKKLLEKVTVSVKTAQPHTVLELDNVMRIFFDNKNAHLMYRKNNQVL